MSRITFSSQPEELHLRCWVQAVFNKSHPLGSKKRIFLGTELSSNVSRVEDLFTSSYNLTRQYTKPNHGFEKFVGQVNKYAKVIDVFIQQYPDITAVLWGSIRFIVQVAVEEGEQGDQVSEALANIVQSIGRWRILFLDEFWELDRIHAGLIKLYASIVDFLVRTKRFYSKSKAVRLARAALTPSREDFTLAIKNILKQAEKLEQDYHWEASFRVRELASQLQASSAEAHRLTRVTQHTIRTELSQLQNRLAVRGQDQVTKMTFEWLYASDDQKHMGCSEPQVGTGKGILESAEYQAWDKGEGNQLLFITGTLGSGKTMFSKILFTERRTTHGILYHIPTVVDGQAAKTTPFINFVLAHVLEYGEVAYQPNLAKSRDALNALRLLHAKDSAEAPFTQMWPILRNMLDYVDRMTLIIDGIDGWYSDASQEADAILEGLEDLARTSNAKIIILSRQLPNLRSYELRSCHIDMTDDLVQPDIVSVTSKKLQEKGERLSPQVKDGVLRKINMSSQGNFLWANLLVDYITSGTTTKIQKQRIEEFPWGLNSCYLALLNATSERLDRDELKLRQEIFMILCGAPVSLMVKQINVILAIRPSEKQLDEEELLIDPDGTIFRLCAPFATISRDGYLQFFHDSVKEFLFRDADAKVTDALGCNICYENSHRYLVLKYLSILSCPRYRDPEVIGSSLRQNTMTEEENASQIGEIHLNAYECAALYWAIQLVAISEPESDILSAVQDFLHGNQFVMWSEFIYARQRDNSRILETRCLLQRWYKRLSADLQSQVKISDFFEYPYRRLSRFYREGGEDKILQWLCSYRLGDWYVIAADMENAIETKLATLTGLEESLGREHPLTLRATTEYAKICLSSSKDLFKIVDILTTTVNIQKKVVGFNRIDVFLSLQILGLAQYYLCRFSESLETQSEALTGFLELLGTKNTTYMLSQLYYGFAQEGVGQIDGALSLFQSIYTNRSELLGPENGFALMAQVALSQAQRKLGALKTAKINSTTAYKTRKKNYGLTSFLTVDCLIHLIIVCRESGSRKEAQEYVDIGVELGGLDTLFERFCQIYHLRGLLQADAGKRQDAISTLREALCRSVQAGRDSNNRALLWLRLDLAKLLREHGQNDEALEVFDDIVTFKDSDSDSVKSLLDEPQPPKILVITEEALEFVRKGDQGKADSLLAKYSLVWKREADFWIPLGGPYADTACMLEP
ncbi:hypothetical protein BJ875DRAFT_500714 [Amylocarpus encephaloides]|uniref:NACHT domain-containing protein n=1 Tax=Amylocarpus encephaloides TaxID=45428 RepID=A0A9P7Y6M9_9HELO|nr:hypothetical protein BJ875DRAFT_500714 [Amylocarpus encephaloides]